MSKKWKWRVEQENILAHILFRSIEYICVVFVFMHLASCAGTSSDDQGSITVDPFDYQGECELDESQLDNAEKEAIMHAQKYAEQFSISPALIMAIIRQESNFDPNAIGDAGLSIGYMQLYWAAAYDAGYRSSRDIFPGFSQESQNLAKEDWPIDGLDKDTNIQYGTGYINICYNQYQDDPVYADPLKSTVSCYNLGRTTGPSLRNETTYVNPVVEFYNDFSDICEASEVTFYHRPVHTHYSFALKLLDFSGARAMMRHYKNAYPNPISPEVPAARHCERCAIRRICTRITAFFLVRLARMGNRH